MYWMLEQVVNRWNKGIETVMELLGQSPQNFQGGAGWRIVEQLHPVFVAIATSLLVMFFFMSLVSESINIRDKLTFDNMIKMLIRLLLSQWLVINGIELIKALFQSVGALINMLRGYVPLSRLTISPEVEAMIENAGTLERILPTAMMMLIWVVALAVGYMLLFVVYFRFFKIYTAVVLSPIALAPLAGNSTSGTPRQFTKYLINITVEAVTMVLAIMVFTAITNSGNVAIEDTSNMWSLVLYSAQLLFGMAVTLGGVKAAEMTTKNILGL